MQKLKGLWIPAEITPIVKNINRYSQDVQEGIETNNYSDSQNNHTLWLKRTKI